MKQTRRKFITSALTVAPAIPFMPDLIRLTAPASVSPAPLQLNGHTLVIIQLVGGNDGLNTVIPYSDGRYYDYRPNLAIPQEKVLPLNSEVGLHPSLAKLKQLWDEKALAIVEGVGYPNPNYSHFESMRIWQTASPEAQAKDGWLGRYFNSVSPLSQNLLPGLSIGAVTPPELSSDKVVIPAIQNVPAYQFQNDAAYPDAAQSRIDSLLRLYSASPRKNVFYPVMLDDTAQETDKTIKLLQKTSQSYKPEANYPDTPLANGLKILAEAITGNLGLAVGHVALGSFDTHSDQERVQSGLFTTLGDALFAFYQDIKAHNRADDVVIMTWSEFGRRVKGNASNGTDHGSVGPMFVIGKPVAGGLYGQRADLGNLDNGNLRFTTDFRAVYGAILDKWLGASATGILGATFGPLSFLSPTT